MFNQSNSLRTALGLGIVIALVLWIAHSAISNSGSSLFAAESDTDEAGDGADIEQHKALGDIHAVKLELAADATISLGDKNEVTVSAPQRVMKHVDIVEEDGALKVKTHGHVSMKDDTVHVAITVKRLDAVTLTTGETTIDGVKGDQFKLQVEGVNEVTATGQVREAQIEVNGAGKLHLDELEAATTKVEINGAATAEVRATESLEAQINGAGKVVYSGAPAHVGKHVNGVGTVEAAT